MLSDVLGTTYSAIGHAETEVGPRMSRNGANIELESSQLVNSLFALIPIPVAVADAKGRIVLANSCFRDAFPDLHNIEASMLREVTVTDRGAFDLEVLPLNESGMKIVYGLDVTKELILRRQLTLFELREKRSLNAGRRELVNLNEVMTSVANTLRPHLANLRISISVVAAQDLPFVLGDRERLEKVVFTLVVGAERSIAVSERRSGSIELRTFADNGRVHASVADNGSGIHIGDIGVTAEPPACGSLSPYRPISLGLCADIVKDHGGELFSWCNYGGGSTYTMKLPTWDASVPDYDSEETAGESDFSDGDIRID